MKLPSNWRLHFDLHSLTAVIWYCFAVSNRISVSWKIEFAPHLRNTWNTLLCACLIDIMLQSVLTGMLNLQCSSHQVECEMSLIKWKHHNFLCVLIAIVSTFTWTHNVKHGQHQMHRMTFPSIISAATFDILCILLYGVLSFNYDVIQLLHFKSNSTKG